MATSKENPMKASLTGGTPRRRQPGERAGAGAIPEEERMLTVSIPISLHRQLKTTAANADESMRLIVIRALRNALDQ